jgi:AcrR family transcriptional regulator
MRSPGDRPYRGVPMTVRREARRQRLIDAAFVVYGRVGYAGATVRLICAEAGLTARYFYESFTDPQALLLAAFEAAIGNLDQILRGALAAAPPDQESRLRAVLTAYYGRLRDDAAVARVFLADMHGASPAIDAHFRAVLHQFGAAFVEITPKIANAPPIFADGLGGGLNQIALAWTDSGYGATLEAVVDAALLLFAGVR